MTKLEYFRKTPNWWVEFKDYMFTLNEAFEGTHNYHSKNRPRYKYWKMKSEKEFLENLIGEIEQKGEYDSDVILNSLEDLIQKRFGEL